MLAVGCWLLAVGCWLLARDTSVPSSPIRSDSLQFAPISSDL